MTNELSKQICEICGIKDNVDFAEAKIFVKLQNKLTEMGMAYSCTMVDLEPTIIEISFIWDDPDFTFKTRGNNFIEAYLRFVLQTLELDEDGDIKRTIRKAEWKYD